MLNDHPIHFQALPRITSGCSGDSGAIPPGSDIFSMQNCQYVEQQGDSWKPPAHKTSSLATGSVYCCLLWKIRGPESELAEGCRRHRDEMSTCQDYFDRFRKISVDARFEDIPSHAQVEGGTHKFGGFVHR